MCKILGFLWYCHRLMQLNKKICFSVQNYMKRVTGLSDLDEALRGDLTPLEKKTTAEARHHGVRGKVKIYIEHSNDQYWYYCLDV